MKKCPFCKAEIEDNARFCLYCMKPLNEKEVIPPPKRKKQRWPFVLAAVLLIALVAVLMLMTKENRNLPAESTGVESSSTEQTTEETTENTTQDTQGSDSTQVPTAGTPVVNQKPTGGTTPTTKPTQPDPTPQNTEPSAKEEYPTEGTTEPTKAATEEDPEETTVPELQITEVVYTYRAARAGDDFNAQYQNTGNDIVITGISQPSADGTYDIPSYIDGKKVIAIVANAFSGSSAKIVYIPATVKTIWNYAFAGCGLTDIYFRGNAIYTEGNAFSGSVTIHCSASCSDRNFRYYKNCAANYGATWAEWNG